MLKGPNRALAEKRLAEYRRAVADISSDRTRTEEYKAARLASEYRSARVDVETLRRSDLEWRENRATELGKRLFGDLGKVTGQDALSMRDAFSVARDLKSPDEAALLLNQAELTGDTVLGRAILARCVEGAGSGDDAMATAISGASPWANLARQYAAAHPLTAPGLAELAELQAPEGMGDKFMDHAAFSVPVPDVLRQPGTNISDLADKYERGEIGEAAPVPTSARGGGSRSAGFPFSQAV
jgi:hypothetical protein